MPGCVHKGHAEPESQPEGCAPAPQQQEACDDHGAVPFYLLRWGTGWAPATDLSQVQWHCQSTALCITSGVGCSGQCLVAPGRAAREGSQLPWHPKVSAPISDQLHRSVVP